MTRRTEIRRSVGTAKIQCKSQYPKVSDLHNFEPYNFTDRLFCSFIGNADKNKL
jgi:hypothetical protein